MSENKQETGFKTVYHYFDKNMEETTKENAIVFYARKIRIDNGELVEEWHGIGEAALKESTEIKAED